MNFIHNLLAKVSGFALAVADRVFVVKEAAKLLVKGMGSPKSAGYATVDAVKARFPVEAPAEVPAK